MSEMSDADVFGPQGVPAPIRAAPPVGNGSVVDAPSGTPLNAAQTAYYQNLLKSGQFDPKALPPHQVKEGEEPSEGHFVDLSGNLRQAGQPPAPKELSDADVFGAAVPGAGAPAVETDTRPISQTLGFHTGVSTVANNMLDIMRPGLPGAPGRSLTMPIMNLPLKFMSAIDNDIITKQAKTARPGLIGKVAGEIAATVPLASEELGAIPLGAMQGYLSSESKDPLGKARDTGIGAVGGKLGDVALGGLKNLVAPAIRPAAQWAIDHGISLTPGGILGGMAKNIEAGASKGTIVGPMIGRAQRQGLDDFNLVTIQKHALDPAGLKLKPGVAAGHEAVADASRSLGQAYDAVTPNLTLSKDADLLAAAKAAKEAAKGLPTAYRTRLLGFADSLAGKPGLALSGDQVQELTSTLRQEAADAQRSGDFFTAPYGRAVDDLSAAVSSALERSNPQYAEQLRGLNRSYAALVRIQRAATNAVQDGGVFTPKGLLQAVRATDSSARDSATAQGEALMQDWANKGKDVLPDKLPSNGSIWAHLPELAVTYGVGHEAGVPGIAGMLAAEGAGGLLYTKAGQKIINSALTKRPAGARSVAEVLEALKPIMAYGAATAAPRAMPMSEPAVTLR